MKKFGLIIYFILFLWATCLATESEKLNYVVTYKWGLIHKAAGDVEIHKNPQGNGYELKLIAKTRPWADKIFKVRDTLISVTQKEKYKPVTYTNIAHEKNRFKKDIIKFSRAGNQVKGNVERYKEDKKGNVKHSFKELEATGETYDMLSVYFLLRELDYNTMKTGEVFKANIFSGSKKENLEVKCIGKETIKLQDKTEHEAWHIQFKFTQGEGKKSSDDINCWVSTQPSHIPLLIVGNLPVGTVRVNYVP